MKYDVLVALGSWACAGDKHLQRRALRFITLLTARYNWQSDTLTTGQKEIARLWSVDERTVKREMAHLREAGWLVLKRPSARGRVACYGLGLDVVLAQTAESWSHVGPDFVARMIPPAPEPSPQTVVPFPVQGSGQWPALAARVQAEDPGLYQAWVAPLICVEERDDVLRLRAPSRFHASFLRTHHLSRLAALARLQGCSIELVE
ncbi:hypothetical protein [Jannaschia marina]|uniref:hypothetical protein n=1 Tax=Jannaschia marina TaxID=2741674 RepID=UPI001F260949|nr:hypothetical protein [Jannaschia marina]